MQITLYRNAAEKNRVYKDLYLTNVRTVSGTLRGETDILTPTILFSMDAPPDFNYAYIAEFERFYFCERPVSVRQGLWAVSMRVDVLMSYRDQIGALRCIIARQQTGDAYMSDPAFPLRVTHAIDYIQLADPANARFGSDHLTGTPQRPDACFCLITAKGD